MLIIKLSGFIALITSIVGLLPQLVKTLHTRSAKDVSQLMLINYLLCSIAWIIYGGYTDTGFVLWSNVLGGLTSAIMLVVKYRYDRI